MSKSILRLFTIVFFSVLWTLNPIPFVSSEQNLNFGSIEKNDIILLKNEIVALKLSPERNIFATTFDNPINSFESSIYDMEEISYKEETSTLVPIDIKTKTRKGKNSIFVQAFQDIQNFPGRRKFKCYDASTNRLIKPSVMLKAHLTCIKNIEKLPRQINKKDKKIKFDKKYSGLFKKNANYEKVFGYSLYLEENMGKDSSKNKIKQGEQKLFKKYGEISNQYLRKNLFENPCVIKSEKCKYLDTDNLVTIYYDELTDLFAILDSNKNTVLDFGVATEVKYAEIFAYKSLGTKKIRDICVSEKPLGEYQNEVPRNNKPVESKELEVYRDPYIISYDDALAILEARYGSNFIAVENGEFKISDWQAAKKIEHTVCFTINPEDYGFSQDQAKAINKPGGIVSYLRKGQRLPSLDLIRAYQNAIKNFCEDRNQSTRNDESIFRRENAITFFNQDTRQIVVFNRETKIFITAYKLAERSVDEYLTTGNLGSN